MNTNCKENAHTFGLPSPSPPAPATPFGGGDFPMYKAGSATKISSSFLPSGNALEIAAGWLEWTTGALSGQHSERKT